MIMVMWWSDITTYVMVAWLEKCACSSIDISTLLFLSKKMFFFSIFLERNGFLLQGNATMIKAGTLKGAMLGGDWADDHTKKRKQGQVATKPRKI